jgi:hypothetical protein
MQHEAQRIIWILGLGLDKIMEIEPNKKNFFSKETIEQSYKHDFFSLFDLENDLMYSIDLNTGEVIFNGVAIEICKEANGRLISFSNLNIDYRKGLIQYKESFPVIVGSKEEIKPKNFNIGYQIDVSDLNIKYPTEHYTSQIKNVKFIMSIDSTTLKPRVSITITELRKGRDGKECMIKV